LAHSGVNAHRFTADATADDHDEGQTMTAYTDAIEAITALKEQNGPAWDAINPEYVAHAPQNRFKTGLEIAQYTADIMRRDMAEYDADSSVYTQSLGVWHGFIGQQKLISIKKHLKSTNKRYLYLSGWMVAACGASSARSRPVDAREDSGSGPHRRAVHLPPPGRHARARPALHEARRRARGR
jgi:isocitrate lyase